MIMILLHLVQTAIYSGKCSDSDKVVQLRLTQPVYVCNNIVKKSKQMTATAQRRNTLQ